MEEHGLMDSGGNFMDSNVIHASPRQSICVQLSPVNCDPCRSSKLSMKSKEVVTRFHRCPHWSTAIHWQRSMLRHGSPWLPFLCSAYCLTGGQTNSIEGHCNPWLARDIHKCPSSSITIHCSPWKALDCHGLSWMLIDCCGHPWLHMEAPGDGPNSESDCLGL